MVMAAVSVALAGLVVVWMWETAQVPTSASPEPVDLLVRKAQLRVDLIRNLLGVFAGMGALVALLVAIRRQYVQERVDHVDQDLKARAAADSKHDADERRLTELYVKAAEQLGSEKAPVRLAALYALDRIGQGNPAQRQTITNVICAYLRMPYEPPQPTDQGTELVRFGNPPELRAAERQRRLDEEQRRREEREVRLTAQGILARRLRPPLITLGEDYDIWDVSLDLSYATLIDFDFSRCIANAIDVRSARFIGRTNFAGFQSNLYFIADDAIFEGDANFRRANFGGNLLCSAAVFHGGATFNEIEFAANALFQGTIFKRGVRFTNHKGQAYKFDGASALASIKCVLPTGWRMGETVSGDFVDIVRSEPKKQRDGTDPRPSADQRNP
ncbi:pentapeptide repeat-containing protein [Micromonospora sp. CA-240977]|uniref:pentapeptide repeat-containing protein n=1 Tax=Micromonospora sp. CA-240977 TaxID=3239957 RepID=UPI003D90993B